MVQFDPRDGEVTVKGESKKVRNITVQQAGFGPYAVRVSATVWTDSHGHIPLAKGDLVAFEGKYEMRKSNDDEGNERTFHNVSVLRLKNLGGLDDGESRPASTSSADAADDVDDDDIPF